MPTRELRLGGVLIRYNSRRFTLTEVHDPHRFVTIEDTDTADLILFLYRQSKKAADCLEVVERKAGDGS